MADTLQQIPVASRALPALAPYLPSDFIAAPPDPNRPGLIRGGLQAGWVEGIGNLGSTAAAIGSATNSPNLQNFGQQLADRQVVEAQQVGRPDLEGNVLAAPTWGGVAQRAGYQVAKMVPMIGGTVAGAGLATMFGAPAGAAALGAGALAMAPQVLASQYEQERQSPGGVTPEKSLKAIGLTAPVALASAAAPAGFLVNKFAGNIFSRFAGGALTGAAANAVGSGLGTAADMSFRPDIPQADKMHAIVDSMASSAIVGGLVGGAFGTIHKADPATMPTDAIKAQTDMLVPKEGAGEPASITPDTTPQTPEASAAGAPLGIDAVLNTAPAVAATPKVDPYAGLDAKELAEVQKSAQAEADLLAARAERNPGLQPKADVARAALAEVNQSVDAREGPVALPEQPLLPDATLRAMTPEEEAGGPIAPPEAVKEPDTQTSIMQANAPDIQPVVEEPSLASKTTTKPAALLTTQDRIKAAYEQVPLNKEGEADIADLRDVLQKSDTNLDGIAKQTLSKAFKAMDRDDTDTGFKAKLDGQLTDRDRLAAVIGDDGRVVHKLWIPEEERATVASEQIPLAGKPAPAPPTQNGILPGGLRPADPRFTSDTAKTELQTRIAQSEAMQRAINGKTVRMEQLPEAPRNGDARPTVSAVPPEDVVTENQLRQKQMDALLREQGDMTPAKRERVEQAAAHVAVGIPDAARAEVEQFNEPTARFSFTPKAPLMSGDLTQKAWERATRDLSPESLASIHIVKTAADLPPEVVEGAMRAGLAPNEISGLHYQGRNYIIGDKIRSPADLQETIFHEVLGHQGARALTGDKYRDTMYDIFTRAGGVDGILRIADKFKVGDELREYLPADPSSMTVREAVRFSDEMLAQVQGRAQDKFSLALREWAGNIKQAVLDTMRKIGMGDLADRWSSFSPLDTAAMLGKMRDVMAPGGALSPMQREIAFRRTVQGADHEVSAVTKVAERAKDTFFRVVESAGGPLGLKDAVHKKLLYFSSMGDIANIHEKLMPQTRVILDALGMRKMHGDRIAQVHAVAARAEDKLRAVDPKAAELLQEMQRLTEYDISPAKTWGQHTWLHDLPNAEALKGKVEQVNKDYRDTLRKNKNGAGAVYDQLVMSENIANYMNIAGVYHGLVTGEHKGIIADVFKVDPIEHYRTSNELHEDLTGTRAYMSDVVRLQRAAVSEYLNEKRGAAVAGVPFDDKVAALAELHDRAGASLTKQEQAPNFSLGRDGTFFASAHFLKGADGLPDPRAIEAAQKLLKTKKFGDLSLDPASAEAHFFARVQTLDKAKALQEAFKELGKQGWLDTDPKKGPKFGSVGSLNEMKGLAPVYMQRLMALSEEHAKSLLADGASDAEVKAAESAVGHMKALWLDMLPNNSAHKSFQEREGKQGYDTDMMKARESRIKASTNAIAHQATARQLADAFAAMHQDVRTLRSGDDVVAATRAANVASEMGLREAQHMWTQPRGWRGVAQSINTGYFLGASPAYSFLQVAQLGITALPELARTYGYKNAATSMGRVTAMAFKVMSATAHSDHGADALFTPQALRKAKIPEKVVQKIMAAVNSGSVESFARANAGSGTTGALAKTLRYANVMGLYSEQFSRVVQVLAAHDLHERTPGKTTLSASDYAAQSVRNGLFDFASHTNPRAFGQMGLAGNLSPLVTAFHNYQVRLIGSLYKNVYDVIKGDTPAERAAARRFLGGHMAAVIATSGAFGLPGAAAFAGAATRLTGVLNDGESYDVEAGIRNFFSDMLGHTLGEAVTRGIPRTLGVDLARVGEGDIIPGTQLLADRRKLEDALPDYAMHTLGSPFSMMASAVVGARDIALGKGLQGLQEFMPIAVKNGIAAYRMTQGPNGKFQYLNSKGQTLPIEPDAMDVLAKAVGFTPGGYATYQEQNRALKGAEAERRFRSANIEHEYVAAAQKHDQAGVAAVMQKAREFSAEHPHQADLPRLGPALARHLKEMAIARPTGAPLGMPINDPALQRLIRFGDSAQR